MVMHDGGCIQNRSSTAQSATLEVLEKNHLIACHTRGAPMVAGIASALSCPSAALHLLGCGRGDVREYPPQPVWAGVGGVEAVSGEGDPEDGSEHQSRAEDDERNRNGHPQCRSQDQPPHWNGPAVELALGRSRALRGGGHLAALRLSRPAGSPSGRRTSTSRVRGPGDCARAAARTIRRHRRPPQQPWLRRTRCTGPPADLRGGPAGQMPPPLRRAPRSALLAPGLAPAYPIGASSHFSAP